MSRPTTPFTEARLQRTESNDVHKLLHFGRPVISKNDHLHDETGRHKERAESDQWRQGNLSMRVVDWQVGDDEPASTRTEVPCIPRFE